MAPRPLRRPLLAPLMVLVAVTMLVSVPLLVIAAATVPPELPGAGARSACSGSGSSIWRWKRSGCV